MLAAKATVRDCPEESDSLPLSSSSSETTSCSSDIGVEDGAVVETGVLPNIWLPKEKGLGDVAADEEIYIWKRVVKTVRIRTKHKGKAKTYGKRVDFGSGLLGFLNSGGFSFGPLTFTFLC